MTWHHDHIGNKAHHPRLFVKCGGDIRREADGTGKMPAFNFAHPGWWVGRNGEWRECRILACEQKGKHLVAQIDGIVVPEEAVKFKGMDVALHRAVLPASGDNEFYKVDLVGLDVVNEEGGALGRVVELYTNGAHDVLRIESAERERLIPFVPSVVRQVDMDGGAIHVTWGLDW